MFIISPISASGILQYHWIDPGGTIRDLTQQTSPALFVSKGATGLGDVDVDLSLEKVPFGSGSMVRHASVPPRQIELPITAIEESLGDLVLVADALRSWFGTARELSLSPGALRVTRPDGSIRQIAAHRTGGIGGDLSQGAPNAMTYVVSLVCPDPYPTADAEVVHTYGLADFGVEQIIINPGELEAYPIWTILGPITFATPSILVRRDSTDEEFSFDDAFVAGLGVIVDTRLPSSGRTTHAVRRYPDDQNIYGALKATSSMWWLAPGENRFTITLSGATSATSVELRYLPRYRGLLR